MKVLLTGGAGFIGSHTAEQLLSAGYQVHAVDNLVTGSRHYVPAGVIFHEMNMNDPKMRELFESIRPDVVVHLAAQTSVVHSMREPYYDFQTNTDATLKLLNYAAEYGVKQFLFTSTSAVYGEPEYFPADEEHSVDPQSFYALSKYTAERYIQKFAALHQFTPTILRLSNVYGPRQNTVGEAGVVGIFILNNLKKEKSIIYGGQQTRDFIYVKDVAAACVRAIELKTAGVMNISSNEELSVTALHDVIAEKMGTCLPADYQLFRKGELVRSVLANEKAQGQLKWTPAYSLSEGLDETIAHIRNAQKISTITDSA